MPSRWTYCPPTCVSHAAASTAAASKMSRALRKAVESAKQKKETELHLVDEGIVNLEDVPEMCEQWRKERLSTTSMRERERLCQSVYTHTHTHPYPHIHTQTHTQSPSTTSQDSVSVTTG